MKLGMTAGFYLLEQDHISDGSGGFGAFASTFNSSPFSVPSEYAADSRSLIPVLKSSNSRRRTVTIRLTSLILSANSSSRISTRPASESALQTCCSSVSSSDRLTALNPRSARPETRASGQFVIALYLALCNLALCSLLVPEVCVRQILVQLRPERLVPFPGIPPCPRLHS